MSRSSRLLVSASALVLALTAAGCGGSALAPGFAVSADAAVNGIGPRVASAQVPTAANPTPGTAEAPVLDDLLPAAATDPFGGSSGSGPKPAALGPRAGAACVDLHDETGITDSTVTIANVSDITGPVPGIFTSAQQATRAFAAYFNATSRLCGRKLEVLGLDSRTDAGADQRAYTTACDKAFAAVGSMAAFDVGGAPTAARCGLPDIRSQSVSDERNACRTCFGAQATELHAFQNAIPDFMVAHHRKASQHSGIVYVREAASVQTAKYAIRAQEKRGMHFVYSSSFDVAEFNYTPYVQAMKDKGVRLLQFIGSPDQAVRFATAMQSYDFRPEVFVLDPTMYTDEFRVSGGAAVEGAVVYLNFLPFEDAGANAEMKLYRSWLQQVAPGAVPTYFGLFAWSAARLFTEQAQALGSNLSRASLVRRMRAVDAWTDHGLHAPQAVGPKRNGSCWRFVTVHKGRWTPVGGSDYTCHGSTVIH